MIESVHPQRDVKDTQHLHLDLLQECNLSLGLNVTKFDLKCQKYQTKTKNIKNSAVYCKCERRDSLGAL